MTQSTSVLTSCTDRHLVDRSFVEGFCSGAIDHGLDDQQIAELMYKAAADPAVAEAFAKEAFLGLKKIFPAISKAWSNYGPRRWSGAKPPTAIPVASTADDLARGAKPPTAIPVASTADDLARGAKPPAAIPVASTADDLARGAKPPAAIPVASTADDLARGAKPPAAIPAPAATPPVDAGAVVSVPGPGLLRRSFGVAKKMIIPGAVLASIDGLRRYVYNAGLNTLDFADSATGNIVSRGARLIDNVTGNTIGPAAGSTLGWVGKQLARLGSRPGERSGEAGSGDDAQPADDAQTATVNAVGGLAGLGYLGAAQKNPRRQETLDSLADVSGATTGLNYGQLEVLKDPDRLREHEAKLDAIETDLAKLGPRLGPRTLHARMAVVRAQRTVAAQARMFGLEGRVVPATELRARLGLADPNDPAVAAGLESLGRDASVKNLPPGADLLQVWKALEPTMGGWGQTLVLGGMSLGLLGLLHGLFTGGGSGAMGLGLLGLGAAGYALHQVPGGLPAVANGLMGLFGGGSKQTTRQSSSGRPGLSWSNEPETPQVLARRLPPNLGGAVGSAADIRPLGQQLTPAVLERVPSRQEPITGQLGSASKPTYVRVPGSATTGYQSTADMPALAIGESAAPKGDSAGKEELLEARTLLRSGEPEAIRRGLEIMASRIRSDKEARKNFGSLGMARALGYTPEQIAARASPSDGLQMTPEDAAIALRYYDDLADMVKQNSVRSGSPGVLTKSADPFVPRTRFTRDTGENSPMDSLSRALRNPSAPSSQTRPRTFQEAYHDWTNASRIGGGVDTLLSFLPVLGAIPAGMHADAYARRGDMASANRYKAMSLASLVPTTALLRGAGMALRGTGKVLPAATPVANAIGSMGWKSRLGVNVAGYPVVEQGALRLMPAPSNAAPASIPAPASAPASAPAPAPVANSGIGHPLLRRTLRVDPPPAVSDRPYHHPLLRQTLQRGSMSTPAGHRYQPPTLAPSKPATTSTPIATSKPGRGLGVAKPGGGFGVGSAVSERGPRINAAPYVADALGTGLVSNRLSAVHPLLGALFTGADTVARLTR